jgi:hypothetical protein
MLPEPQGRWGTPYESCQITALIANANGIFGIYSITSDLTGANQ